MNLTFYFNEKLKHPLNINNNSIRYLPHFLLFLVILFFATVSLSLHSWESYMYASGIEGFHDISKWLNIFRPDIELPNISRFNPYHPMPHFLTAIIYDLSGGAISALFIITVLNKIAATIAIVFLYKFFFLFTKNTLTTVFVCVLIFFSNVFLYGALSGEAHILSFSFLIGAVYYLLKFSMTPKSLSKLYLSSSLLSLCVACNLSALPIGASIFLVTILSQKESTLKKRFILLLIPGFFLMLMGVLVYIALLSYVLKIHTVEEYINLVTIYFNLPSARSLEILTRLYYTFKSFWLSTLLGDSFATLTIILLYVAAVIFGGYRFYQNSLSRPISRITTIWLISFIIKFFIAPFAINGYIFVIIPIFIFLTETINILLKKKFSLVFVLLFTFAYIFNNYQFGFKQKIFSDEKEIMLLKQFDGKLNKAFEVLFVIADANFAYPEIWYLGHSRSLRKQNMIIAPLTKNINKVIFDYINQPGQRYLITFKPLNRTLPQGVKLIYSKRAFIEKTKFHESVYHHRQSLFNKAIYVYLIDKTAKFKSQIQQVGIKEPHRSFRY